MKKEEKQPMKKEEKKESPHGSNPHEKGQMKKEVDLIRILAKDIPGTQTVYSGLTLIKGISWAFSNAVCKKLGINKKKKVEELSKEEIRKLEEFINDGIFSGFLLNRRKDLDSGENKHLVGSDLDLQKDFDIKRLKKIKSYRGIRHVAGLPLRGQRTKSNFRKNRRKGSGIKKKVKVVGGKK